MANSVNRYFEGLLVGGTLGFVFGLLTAPKPGSELRREIADSADDLLKQANVDIAELKDRVNEKVQPLADKATEFRSQAKEKATEVREKVAQQGNDLRDRINEKVQPIAEKACELREQAGTKFDEIKDKASELKDKATELKAELKEKIVGPNGQELLNNYMGHNSGPVYTAGHKVSPDTSAMPVSDSCSNFSAGKAGEGAAGG